MPKNEYLHENNQNLNKNGYGNNGGENGGFTGFRIHCLMPGDFSRLLKLLQKWRKIRWLIGMYLPCLRIYMRIIRIVCNRSLLIYNHTIITLMIFQIIMIFTVDVYKRQIVSNLLNNAVKYAETYVHVLSLIHISMCIRDRSGTVSKINPEWKNIKVFDKSILPALETNLGNNTSEMCIRDSCIIPELLLILLRLEVPITGYLRWQIHWLIHWRKSHILRAVSYTHLDVYKRQCIPFVSLLR